MDLEQELRCPICGSVICQHGAMRFYTSGKVECLDCGITTYEVIPVVYSLPMKDSVVDWRSGVFFPVCVGCYNAEMAVTN